MNISLNRKDLKNSGHIIILLLSCDCVCKTCENCAVTAVVNCHSFHSFVFGFIYRQYFLKY